MSRLLSFILFFPTVLCAQESDKRILGFGIEKSFQWNTRIKYVRSNFPSYANNELIFQDYSESYQDRELLHFFSGWNAHLDLRVGEDNNPKKIASQLRFTIGYNKQTPFLIKGGFSEQIQGDTVFVYEGGSIDTLFRDTSIYHYRQYSVELRNMQMGIAFIKSKEWDIHKFLVGIGINSDFSIHNKLEYRAWNNYQYRLQDSWEYYATTQYYEAIPAAQPAAGTTNTLITGQEYLDYQTARTFSTICRLYIPAGIETRLACQGFLSKFAIYGTTSFGLELGLAGRGFFFNRWTGRLDTGIKYYL